MPLRSIDMGKGEVLRTGEDIVIIAIDLRFIPLSVRRSGWQRLEFKPPSSIVGFSNP